MASRAVVARFFSTEMHHGSVTPPDAIEMDGDEYDARADDVLDNLFDAVDQACEKDGSKISSVDLHDGGVLEVETDNGQTFVINKHEASKLLWYSSPVSGPGYFAPEMKDGKKWWSEALNASVFDQFSRDLREMGSTALPKFRSAEGQQQTFTLEAYAKPQLHAVKHQQDDVIGVLLGTSEDTVTEAVPLFHCGIVGSPVMKLGLSLVDAYCQKKELKVVALYTSAAKPTPVVRQMATALGKYSAVIIYCMQVRSKKVTMVGYSPD
ncbi:Mitochondrial chaperone Frataxin, partial [Perkinsus olseni]